MSSKFIFGFSLFLMIPISVLVYFMLPKLFYKFESKAFHTAQESNFEKEFLKFFAKVPFPEKFKSLIIKKLYESGIGDQNTWMYWIIITIFMPVILFIILTIQNYSFGVKLALSALCFVIPNLYLSSLIEKRKRAFIISAYKLYYFLHSQISSGIKATDAIKGIYEIADHPLIQKTFIQFVAQYELTLNIEESLQIIRKSFSGYDCEMLCVSIQQCVNTGMAGKTLLKMEQMMFSKYFFYLQKDTAKFRTKLVISGVFAIAPLVMIFLFPVVYDAFKAFGNIMSIG